MAVCEEERIAGGAVYKKQENEKVEVNVKDCPNAVI